MGFKFGKSWAMFLGSCKMLRTQVESGKKGKLERCSGYSVLFGPHFSEISTQTKNVPWNVNKYNQTARNHPRQVAPSWACGTLASWSGLWFWLPEMWTGQTDETKKGFGSWTKQNYNEMWNIWWIAERWPKPVRKPEREMDADQKSTSTVR